MLATGESHTVREFIERAFAVVGRRIEWRGEGVDEVGIDEASGKELVKVDPRYFRPTEVDVLHGDATKARTKLGWKHRVNFDDLVDRNGDQRFERGTRRQAVSWIAPAIADTIALTARNDKRQDRS